MDEQRSRNSMARLGVGIERMEFGQGQERQASFVVRAGEVATGESHPPEEAEARASPTLDPAGTK